MAERDLTLGIDIGTGSAKCVLVSAEGGELAAGSAGYSFASPEPGWAEQDPEDWWRAACAAVRQALARSANLAARIAAIAVCGQGAGAVLVDRRLQPVRPAILWLDARSAVQAQRLNDRNGDRIAALSGKRPAAYNVEPKLLWVKKNEPEAWGRTVLAITPTAWCTLRLSGRAVMNHSDAGILLGYDLRSRQWTGELSRLIEVPTSIYAELAECEQVVGEVTAEAAAATGLRAGTLVLAGGEDTSAAALAAGVSAPGTGILSLGNAGTIYTSHSQPVTHPHLLSFPHVLRDQTLVGGSTVGCGSGLDWICRLLGGSADRGEEIFTAAATSRSRQRLVFLPYLSGELQPINDGFARGVFFGLDFAASPEELTRAVVEGIAFSFAHILELSRELGTQSEAPPARLAAVGSPSRNHYFMQTVADATGLPVTVMEERGGAAFGAAVLAARAVFGSGDAERMAAAGCRSLFEALPDPTRWDRLAPLYSIYKDLYPRLRDLYPRLQSASGPHSAAAKGE